MAVPPWGGTSDIVRTTLSQGRFDASESHRSMRTDRATPKSNRAQTTEDAMAELSWIFMSRNFMTVVLPSTALVVVTSAELPVDVAEVPVNVDVEAVLEGAIHVEVDAPLVVVNVVPPATH
mmetsp:Transcript_80206/g.211412  ORF Transcript_80206/g.211412 Transcript_80206/m.211412 type:complete len:121 (+) Transcript_80206:23-385(+)